MSTEKLYTMSDEATASNPGRAKVNPLVWTVYHPVAVGFRVMMIALSGYWAIQHSWWWGLLMAPFLFSMGYYWLAKKEHFKHGDSNGGLVVGVKPYRVAVATSLTKVWGEEYPVVKVIEVRSLKKLSLGDRIPTVALYYPTDDEKDPHWETFDPIPLHYITWSRKKIDRAMGTYPAEQWEALREGLEEIEDPTQLGLYRVKQETSHWALLIPDDVDDGPKDS